LQEGRESANIDAGLGFIWRISVQEAHHMLNDCSVSVVVPAFNRNGEVGNAIRSALDQTLPPLEVIIVDDASTVPLDKTEIEAIAPNVRLIRHPINLGGGSARNTGLDAAKGEWVAFLDSDDHWHPEKLQRQFHGIVAAGDHPKIVAATNVLERAPGVADRPYNLSPPPPDRPLNEWFLIDGGTFQTSSLLMRTQFAREVRFDTRLKRHQDWDFLIRLEHAGAVISYIHECLAIYGSSPSENQITQSKDPKPTLDWYSIAGDRISPEAKYRYYANFWFYHHRQQSPVHAAVKLIELSMRYPRSLARTTWWLVKYFVRLLTRPVRRRMRRTEAA
jgi:glycosyltransferase involved in cell wall biosynthesis